MSPNRAGGTIQAWVQSKVAMLCAWCTYFVFHLPPLLTQRNAGRVLCSCTRLCSTRHRPLNLLPRHDRFQRAPAGSSQTTVPRLFLRLCPTPEGGRPSKGGHPGGGGSVGPKGGEPGVPKRRLVGTGPSQDPELSQSSKLPLGSLPPSLHSISYNILLLHTIYYCSPYILIISHKPRTSYLPFPLAPVPSPGSSWV